MSALQSATNDHADASANYTHQQETRHRAQAEVARATETLATARGRTASQASAVERLGQLGILTENLIAVENDGSVQGTPNPPAEQIHHAVERLQRAAAAQSVDAYRGQVEELDREIRDVQEAIESETNSLKSLQGLRDNRRLLATHSRDAASEVVTEVFAQLQPVVDDLIDRLSPHPTFGKFSLVHDVYRGQGHSVPSALDAYTGETANPSTQFSSAQVNVTALCCFLALAFSGSDIHFPFVFLDDPLQSMDDINVLGFADLCRFLRRKKQLFISTHDDRLAALLLRKLTPRSEPTQTQSLQFTSWDRSGPRFELNTLMPEEVSSVFMPVDMTGERKHLHSARVDVACT